MRLPFLSRLFRRPAAPASGDIAFDRLVEKFSRISYLTEQKALLDVVEKAPVGICITNEQRIFEYVNPAYCRIYGYTWEELVGGPFVIVVPPEGRQAMEELHDRFMRKEYELAGEWDVVRKDGTPLRIFANAAYVLDERNRPRKITFVLDVTARRRAESELAQCKAALEAAVAGIQELRGKVDAVTPRQPPAAPLEK